MKEIAYAINPVETRAKGCLVLDLLEANREGHVLSFFPVADTRPVSSWQRLAHLPADREIVAFLFKEASSEAAGNKIYVPPSKVEAAFKLLATTQKLFCEGKQLVIDLYGTAEFYYAARTVESKLEIEGRLRWRETDIALKQCVSIIPGKPLWLVDRITLKMIGTSISWTKIKELLDGPLSFEGAAKQAFLDSVDLDDTDSPQLVFREGSLLEAMHGATPYPILMLTDRWGACADLWMDYGQGNLVAVHDPRPIIKDDRGNIIFKRQEKYEQNWEKDLLETDFIKKGVGTSHYYCPLDLVPKSLSFLLEIGWQIKDHQGRQVIHTSGLNLSLEDRHDKIAIKGRLNYGTFQADVSDVMGAFNRRDSFVFLSQNSVGLLPGDAMKQAFCDLASESEMIGGERSLPKNRLGTLEQLWQYAESSPKLQDLKRKLDHFAGISEALPGTSFSGKLRPYQQEGVNWLAFLHDYGFHGILADEMGLGKTVQILALFSRLPPASHVLVVMPTSLLFNWRNEIHRFLPSIPCTIHQGPQRVKTAKELQQATILLTSYTTLRLDLPLFQSLSYAAVVLDEAQMIKNPHTQIAQAVCQLQAGLRICITGTPVENRLQELWSHFRFLMPDLFGSQEAFEAEIASGESDRRYLDRIKRKIAPFLLRRRKSDVLADLPERIDQIVMIDMSDEQRSFYDSLLAGFKSGLLKKVEAEGVGKHRMEILEALLRLRQACCHPLLLFTLTEETSPSAKFDALLQDLETISEEGHKVLVYSQFTSMLKLMAQAARERNWSFGYLDGSTTNREEVVNRFQEDSEQCLFFISLKAGGVGLNLTAADYVYIYDPWWNEAVEEQAINRAHRIGRKDVVISKRFVMADSIEEKMMKLKAAKKLMIDELMEGDALPNSLTGDDLRELLN